MLDVSYYRKTDEIISRYVRDARSLIPIMQDIQAEYRYLPAELLSYVAKQIGITEAKAYSVATFYENFSFEAKGKYVIKVCDGTACHVRPMRDMPQFLHRLVWIFQFWDLSIKTVSKWRFPVHLLLWKYGTHSTNAVSTRNEHLLRCW